MAYKYYNPNPLNKHVGDCVIRAISKVCNMTWEDTYISIVARGLQLKDMPSSNHVWKSYLYDRGFYPEVIPDTCPYCYTLIDFCNDHPVGTYIVQVSDREHVVAVVHGDYFDTYDSGHEVPSMYLKKGVI